MSKINKRTATATGCFGMRGRIVHAHEHQKRIELVKYDGDMIIYDRPLKAGELMDEFPKHMVCRSDCFYIGQKIPALPQNHRLQPGHKYFLLPASFFQSTFTFASFLRCSSKFSPAAFQIEKTPEGSLRIKLSEEHHQRQEILDVEPTAKMLIITTPQLRKDYEQLVVLMRRNPWKPKLDTILEKKSKHTSRSKRKQRKKES